MDTRSTAVPAGQAALMSIMKEVWLEGHPTDPARAAELIMERMAKEGTTPAQAVCSILDIAVFDPETILRALAEAEYTRSLSIEDKLVHGAGLPPPALLRPSSRWWTPPLKQTTPPTS
jgi:hypothetical protein